MSDDEIVEVRDVVFSLLFHCSTHDSKHGVSSPNILNFLLNCPAH